MSRQKIFVVFKGRVPGIYYSRAEAQKQVMGFEGAKCHSYGSLTEAKQQIDRWLANGKNSLCKKRGVSNGEKFYVVSCGFVPGIYNDWSCVVQQILGFPNPKWRMYRTLKAAEKAYRAFYNQQIWYVVIRGHKPGIYFDRAEAEAQVVDYPYGVIKPCSSYEQALLLIELLLSDYRDLDGDVLDRKIP